MALNMGSVMGIIFANMHDNTIHDITKSRTMGSVLFGGRYRLIDFPLSNMANSGVSEVAVITKENYQSLLDHLGSAREWDLARKKGGLHILPPFGNVEAGLYRGRLEALYGGISFLKASRTEYVILSDCDIIATIDYKPIVKAHVESGADITVVTNTAKHSADVISTSTVVNSDAEGRVVEVLHKPTLEGECSICLNMFVMKKNFLIELLEDGNARGHYSFERDVLQRKVSELNIRTFEFNEYFSKIYSMQSFFKANMDLIDPANSRRLYNLKRPIYTKVRDNAPSKYDLDCVVKSSLIADGCIIEGEVENSVIFRGVKVGKGAKVKNAILMQDTVIEDNAVVTNIITDKDVTVGEGKVVSSTEEYPLYIGKGSVI